MVEGFQCRMSAGSAEESDRLFSGKAIFHGNGFRGKDALPLSEGGPSEHLNGWSRANPQSDEIHCAMAMPKVRSPPSCGQGLLLLLWEQESLFPDYKGSSGSTDSVSSIHRASVLIMPDLREF